MDFIIKLLLSREPIIKIKYDNILVIICKLTKYKYFISYQEISIAEDLAYIFFKFIHNNYGLPEKIISDKNKFFILRFWKSLINQFRIKYKFSTAYHPQTDKQTKRLNQIIK